MNRTDCKAIYHVEHSKCKILNQRLLIFRNDFEKILHSTFRTRYITELCTESVRPLTYGSTLCTLSCRQLKK